MHEEIFHENYETVLIKIILQKLNLSYEFMPYLERKHYPFALNVSMGNYLDVRYRVFLFMRKIETSHGRTLDITPEKSGALHLQEQTLTMIQQSSMSPLVVYEIKRKIFRHKQETYVLFTGSDLKDLKFQIQNFIYHQPYMSLTMNNFSIVMTGTIKKDPKKIAESVQLFMWHRHKLSNILELIPNFNVSTLDVYTWLPFSSETQCNRQLDVVHVSQMTCDNFKQNSNEYLMDFLIYGIAQSAGALAYGYEVALGSTNYLNMCSHNVVSTGCNKSPLCILCYFKMNDVIDNPADCEVRSVIRFLNARHLKPAEIYRQLKEVYVDTVMNERNVGKWCAKCSTMGEQMSTMKVDPDAHHSSQKT
ncbi:hypothetical protein ANN_10342 [Periplaneta americana]|uniref:Uncharacterized protein n=1 Tax=Periplaneta americana TaxID=6978 RepID=A0ABQ8TQM5_PERAM|nr:hypothetical protein ANN_10342 [Periplaneta americana]